MIVRRLRFVRSTHVALRLACVLGALGYGTQVFGQAASLTLRPLYAEQVGPLDTEYFKEGSRIMARVKENWGDVGCRLRPGSVIEGHVIRIQRRRSGEKTSNVEVRFDLAGCNDLPLSERCFTLIALIGPPRDASAYKDFASAEAAPLATYSGLNSAGENLTTPGGAPSVLQSLSAGSTRAAYAPLNQSTRKLPAQIETGQVIDVPKTTLSVGKGVGGATIITAQKRDVRLEPKTILMLVPSGWIDKEERERASAERVREHAEEVARRREASREMAAPKPTLEPPDETEICVDTCNAVESVDARARTDSAASATLPIGRFGYAPHDKRRGLAFDHETALTYLDARHLLCTFDPHRLRGRSSEDEALRSVRAMVIDPATHTIGRVVEWNVRGGDAYLWRVGGGRVLVHMGRELRMFDGDLKVVKSVPANGRVSWIVSSPSGDHVAVGVVKERYLGQKRPESEDAAEKIEEDLDVRVYDGQLNLLSVSTRGEASAAPVLSDEGEVRMARLKVGRWKISEFGWDRSDHEVATLRSSCRPMLSAPDHDLIFVTGCTGTSGVRWYRMLRPDGHAVLKGEAASDEAGQSVEGAGAGAFAVRILRANAGINVEQGFSRADMKREEIAIYRSADGVRVSDVVTDDFILAEDSFALSPAGNQMAVMGKDSISFYPVKLR